MTLSATAHEQTVYQPEASQPTLHANRIIAAPHVETMKVLMPGIIERCCRRLRMT